MADQTPPAPQSDTHSGPLDALAGLPPEIFADIPDPVGTHSTDAVDGTSTVYTSEPMATRALGAELRHRSADFISLIEPRLGLAPGTLGTLHTVQCESKARLDVLMTMRDLQGAEVLVGVEAKFDHAMTSEQLAAEQAVAPYLVLLVVDEADAVEHRGPGRCVVTWAEAIACFPESRLTMADISNIPVTKMRIERAMRTQADRFDQLTALGFDIEVARGGSGMPSIVFRSPALPDGRELRGQVQVCGRGMPEKDEDLRLEYHVGIGVDLTDDDFPDPATASTPPGWINHLEVLEGVVGGEQGQLTLRIGAGRAMNGGGELGQRKLPLVRKFLDDKAWLAKGYANWALGIKSTPTTLAELDVLCDMTQWIFAKWYGVSTARGVSRRVSPR